MPSLFTNNEKVKDPETIAKSFSTFFKWYWKFKLSSDGGDDTTSFLKDTYPRKLQNLH
jgi:hypothetical protein